MSDVVMFLCIGTFRFMLNSHVYLVFTGTRCLPTLSARKKKPAPLPPTSQVKMSALPEEKTQTLKTNKVTNFEIEEDLKQKSATLPSSFPSPLSIHSSDVVPAPGMSRLSSSDEDTVVDFPVNNSLPKSTDDNDDDVSSGSASPDISEIDSAFQFVYEEDDISDSQKLIHDTLVIPPTSEIVPIKSPKREIPLVQLPYSDYQLNSFKKIQKSTSNIDFKSDPESRFQEPWRAKSPSLDKSPLHKLKPVKIPEVDLSRIIPVRKSQSSLGFNENPKRKDSQYDSVLQYSKIPPVFLFGNDIGVPNIIVDDVDLGLDVSNKAGEQFNFFEPPPPYLSNFNRTESNESWTGFLNKLETILSNKTEEYV